MPNEDSAGVTDAGAGYIWFRNVDGSFPQFPRYRIQSPTPTQALAGNVNFGHAVTALDTPDGTYVLFGAPEDPVNGASRAGAVYSIFCWKYTQICDQFQIISAPDLRINTRFG